MRVSGRGLVALLAALLSLLTVGSLTPRAQAYCRLTTVKAMAGAACASEGLPLYWGRSCISYSVVERSHSDSVSLLDLREVIDRSFGNWTDVECGGVPLGLSLQQTPELSTCNVPTYAEQAPNANSVMFLHDWLARGLDSEAFGLTLVSYDEETGEILDADIQINETLGALSLCPNATCPEDAVDLQNVITHEVGHFLGLGHSPDAQACMYGKADVAETSKRFLSLDDIDGTCAIYGDRAVQSCSAVDYLPTNGFGQSCNDPPLASDSSDALTTGGGLCSVTDAAIGGGRRGPSLLAVPLALLLLLATRRRRAR